VFLIKDFVLKKNFDEFIIRENKAVNDETETCVLNTNFSESMGKYLTQF